MLGQLRKIPLKDFSICHEFAMVWMKTRQFSSYYEHLADEFMRGTYETEREA